MPTGGSSEYSVFVLDAGDVVIAAVKKLRRPDVVLRLCRVQGVTHPLRIVVAPLGIVHGQGVDDTQGGYDYPERVRDTLDAAEPEDYIRAAQFLNRGDYHVTCIQHEYGIFGGAAG